MGGSGGKVRRVRLEGVREELVRSRVREIQCEDRLENLGSLLF